MVAKSGTAANGPWRLAYSLVELEKQVDAKYPKRKKTSDGSIGDAAHSARTSDHNAWVEDPEGVWIVTAIDLTHDPANGLDAHKFADMLLKNKDPRIKYVISNRRIGSGHEGQQPWKWRPYNGASAHDKHVHISVESIKSHYDDKAAWKLDSLVKAPPPLPPKLTHPLISLGMTSKDIPYIHERLGMKPYEYFGHSSMKVLQEYQTKHNIPPTGIVDAATWVLFEADKPYV